jgi:putative effector of murein hydrolase LrgA (UPF0299 family)
LKYIEYIPFFLLPLFVSYLRISNKIESKLWANTIAIIVLVIYTYFLGDIVCWMYNIVVLKEPGCAFGNPNFMTLLAGFLFFIPTSIALMLILHFLEKVYLKSKTKGEKTD